jgi:FdhD protein
MTYAGIAHLQVKRYQGSQIKESPDLVAVEEPLEIRIGYGPEHKRKEIQLAVTMRTPGHDLELATGFLFTEGIIQAIKDVLSIRHCVQVKEEEAGNVVRAELSPALEIDEKQWSRHFYVSSSCGVCGKSSMEAVRSIACALLNTKLQVDAAIIHQLPDKLRERQTVFAHTGGLHAAALFTPEGNLLLMREDVGRHNAMDKLVGAALAAGNIPLQNHLVLLSGRASFELVQKALMAEIPLLAAVGAPSSLAVNLSKEFDLTLLGFVRDHRFNIYTGNDRINASHASEVVQKIN